MMPPHIAKLWAEVQEQGVFTEAYLNAVLPPIPDWMRKPPRIRTGERTLFDDEV